MASHLWAVVQQASLSPFHLSLQSNTPLSVSLDWDKHIYKEMHVLKQRVPDHAICCHFKNSKYLHHKSYNVAIKSFKLTLNPT